MTAADACDTAAGGTWRTVSAIAIPAQQNADSPKPAAMTITLAADDVLSMKNAATEQRLISTPNPASTRPEPSRSATAPSGTRHTTLMTSAMASTRPAACAVQPARLSTAGNSALK